MSATTLPDLAAAFNSYAAYVENLLTGRCDPAIVAQVVTVVSGLEAALQRQARDEIDVELRLTALEDNVIRQLEAFRKELAKRSE